jgi:protein-tyrosine phosphatase
MFRILFVCSGNRCRSPFAEAVFKRACRNDWIDASSVGTLDYEGLEPPDEMIKAGWRFDIDLSGHLSRHIRHALVRHPDLLLGMSLGHIASGVDSGADPAKSFTLREFLRLAPRDNGPATSEEQAREIVAEAHRRRLEGPLFSPLDEIRDPMGGPPAGYRSLAEALDIAIRELAKLLCGTS